MTDSRRPSVRAARPSDFEAFYGRRLPYTAWAWVAEQDGEVIGIAGYYVRDGWVQAFADMDDAMRMWPGTIMREAKKFMARLKSPAACIASPAEKNAAGFLEHLGWRHIGTSAEGDVYAWQPQR